MKLLLLLMTLVLAMMLGSLLTVGFALLFIFCKSRTMGKSDEVWDGWFNALTPGKLTAIVGCWYLPAALFSSLAAWWLLKVSHIAHASVIIAVFFVLRLAVSLWNFRKNRDRILEKFRRHLMA